MIARIEWTGASMEETRYVEALSRFWDGDAAATLTPSACKLYLAILHEFAEQDWPDELETTHDDLRVFAKIAVRTYRRAIQDVAKLVDLKSVRGSRKLGIILKSSANTAQLEESSAKSEYQNGTSFESSAKKDPAFQSSAKSSANMAQLSPSRAYINNTTTKNTTTAHTRETSLDDSSIQADESTSNLIQCSIISFIDSWIHGKFPADNDAQRIIAYWLTALAPCKPLIEGRSVGNGKITWRTIQSQMEMWIESDADVSDIMKGIDEHLQRLQHDEPVNRPWRFVSDWIKGKPKWEAKNKQSRNTQATDVSEEDLTDEQLRWDGRSDDYIKALRGEEPSVSS